LRIHLDQWFAIINFHAPNLFLYRLMFCTWDVVIGDMPIRIYLIWHVFFIQNRDDNRLLSFQIVVVLSQKLLNRLPLGWIATTLIGFDMTQRRLHQFNLFQVVTSQWVHTSSLVKAVCVNWLG